MPFYRATFDFEAIEDGQFGFEAGEIIELLEKDDRCAIYELFHE